MNKTRQGELALLFLKEHLRNKGFRMGKNTRREIGSEAAKLGISADEAMEFYKILVEEFVDETFGESTEPSMEVSRGDYEL